MKTKNTTDSHCKKVQTNISVDSKALITISETQGSSLKEGMF